MTFDFNDAGEQRTLDPIPADTIATLQMKIRPGKAGDSQALDCEFTVVDGPYAKRKFWSFLTLDGTTEGHAMARDITLRRLRAILESARSIKPDDQREAVRKARQITGYGDLNGIRFIGKIGIEPAKNGFPAKNILLEVITPNRKEWHEPDNTPVPEGAPTAQQPATATTPS
jgi:hypothetical protein